MIYEKLLGRKHIKTAKSIYLKGNLFLRISPSKQSKLFLGNNNKYIIIRCLNGRKIDT